MAADVQRYVSSCFRCSYAKAPHHHNHEGSLSPTVPPHVHHTWYADFKGPLPGSSGYILAVVEAVTRLTKVRYVPRNTADALEEQLEIIYTVFGHWPKVLRTDNGPPFDSDSFTSFCKQRGIYQAFGVPYHSQGQGLVETRFRNIAASLIASLGAKASTAWYKGNTLRRIEAAMNSTYTEGIRGSPTWAMTGRHPRTVLAAATDFDATGDGPVSEVPFEALTDIVAAHHDTIHRIQARTQLASAVAQTLTADKWEKTHKHTKLKEGDQVLALQPVPNRLALHFTGPYTITALNRNNTFATLQHFLHDLRTSPGVAKTVHVSRLLKIDISRTNYVELTAFQVPEGSNVVEAVKGHRDNPDGTNDFLIQWYGVKDPLWNTAKELRRVKIVLDYCEARGLPEPGKRRGQGGGGTQVDVPSP